MYSDMLQCKTSITADELIAMDDDDGGGGGDGIKAISTTRRYAGAA